SDCRRKWPTRSTEPRTTSSPALWSTPSSPRTTCSLGCATPSTPRHAERHPGYDPARRSEVSTEGAPMAKYLSQEWLDVGRELAQEFAERPGATARMQYVTTGAPEGDVAYFQVLENGKILESTLGEDPSADFTITSTYEDSVKIQKGELDANAAFMQGR